MTQYTQECLRLIRFIWADKVALLVGLLFSSLLFYIWFLAFLVVGNLGAKHLWATIGVLGVELEILIVGSAWLVMRVADFLAGGSTYRLFVHESAWKVLDSNSPSGNEHQNIRGTALSANPSVTGGLVQL